MEISKKQSIIKSSIHKKIKNIIIDWDINWNSQYRGESIVFPAELVELKDILSEDGRIFVFYSYFSKYFDKRFCPDPDLSEHFEALVPNYELRIKHIELHENVDMIGNLKNIFGC